MNNESDELTKNACVFCGFVVGYYGRYRSKYYTVKENTGELSNQVFGGRYKVRSRKLSQYTTNYDFSMKHSVVQKWLMGNQGTAFTREELAEILVNDFGNYQGLSRMLKMMMKCKMLRAFEHKNEVWFTAW